jgi:hypothetical protein
MKHGWILIITALITGFATVAAAFIGGRVSPGFSILISNYLAPAGISSMTKEIDVLTDEKAKLNDENSSLQKEIEQLETDNRNLQERIDSAPAIQQINPSLKRTGSDLPVSEQLIGKWKGTYQTGRGEIGITLDFKNDPKKGLVAEWDFYPLPSNLSVASGSYLATVQIIQDSRVVLLNPGEWIVRPDGYDFVGLSGTLSMNGTVYSGIVGGYLIWHFKMTKQ